MIAQEHAPAKVNLTLHVTGQRTDGYHLLDSLVVFTEVGDMVSATAADGLSLAMTGPEAAGLSVGPDNLVWRAASLMGAADLALVLDKHLPVASGIGGGSSDAAACLRLMARLTGRALPDARATLALGADVPVCLAARPSRMQGVGEDLRPLAGIPDFWLVLVNPRKQVSTPAIFQALAQRENPPMPRSLPRWQDAQAFCDWLSCQRNDLQAPACLLVPEIGQALRALEGTHGCGLARMSGSGATCFGLYANQHDVDSATRKLRTAFPQWWITATTPRQ